MTISSQTRKAGPYNGNGSTTSFPFAFKVFASSDVLVVRTNPSGVETTLTLGTDYTVSLNSNQDSNAGGNVVMGTAPASGYKLTIGSKVPLLQSTDFTNQGGFYPKVLNASLDKLTILTQQLQEEVDRSAKLPISSATDADALVADIIALANDQANLDAVAGDLSNINAVAGNATNINTVAGISANVTTVAGISSDVTAVAGNATNITAVKNNATNINTVAGISSNVTTVAGISANVTSVAGNATNINTNASNITAIQNASTNATNAANSATAAATSASNASTSASAASASAAAAAASAASGLYSTVQDKSADYTIVAGDAGDLIRVTTSGGARTMTLPAISAVGDGFKIAIVKWTSDSNQVTVQRAGSDTINGASTVTIGQQYSQIIFVADAETSTWFASQSGLGATNMNVDVFSGNGSTTAFTLSSDPSTKNNTRVHIGGVYQLKSTYSVSGTTLTFSAAPVSGTSNIEVEYGTPLAIGTPSDDTVSTAKLQANAVTTAKVADGAMTPAKLSTGAPTWDSSGNMGANATPSAWSTFNGFHIGSSGRAVFAGGSGYTIVGENWYNNGGQDKYIANGTAQRMYLNNGNYYIQGAPSGTAGGTITFTNLLNFSKGNTVALEGASQSAGTGISFPASQSASSDANTLDDYEEGTWTPTLLGGTTNPTVTYGHQIGYYTKIGREVTLQFSILISAVSGGSGLLQVGGIPFTSLNTSALRCGGVVVYNDLINLGTGYDLTLEIDENKNYIYFEYAASTNGIKSSNPTTASLVNANRYIQGSITYITA